jgi:hypothetical protein
MQKARDQALALRPIALSLLVSVRFQVLFTPLPGFFSPFPHGTGSLSVAKEYLALGSGLPGFPQGFTCPVVLRISAQRAPGRFVYRAITVYGRSFQIVQLQQRFVTLRGVCGLHRQHPATPDP